MKLIAISDIIIPPRQRKEFDETALKELADGIKQFGLLHPIVLAGEGNPTLRAGERRLRAIRDYVTCDYLSDGSQVPRGSIPFTTTGELSPIEALEVELLENLHREDFTWQEEQDGLARLHALRTSQAEDGGKPQTFAATAAEVVGKENVTSNDVLKVRTSTIIAPFLSDPEVRGAKNEREALSIVRRKITQQFTSALAENQLAAATASPHTLLIGSCIDLLPGLAPESFDVIISDPPYGINAHRMTPLSSSNSGMMHEYEDTYEDAEKIWISILHSGFRAAKNQAHLYLFCDFRYFGTLSALAKTAGWDVWSTPLIWYKPGGGMLGDSTRGPRKCYETILYARKGDKRVSGVYPDVIEMSGVDTSLHAAAKPAQLYINLLRRSTLPGDKVLDPCAGSCPIFPAANALSLRATAIEVSNTHAKVGLLRMNEKG